MRFLMIYTSPNHDPDPEKMKAIGEYGMEMTKAGVLLDTGGMKLPGKGTRVRQANGKATITDGPYPETKELIAGYAIVQARSHEEAIEHAKRFMSIAGDGESEILRLWAPGEIDH
jgi:hypothetical protein